MATNRFGYSDDFVLKNGKVGINTAEPQATLDVQGTIKATNLKTTGVTTVTAYEGFLNADHKINESTTITNGASLSGEIIVGTGVTVTVGAVGVATALVGIGTNYTGSSNIDTTDVNVASQGAIDSLKVYNTFNPPVGGTNDRPIKAKPGQLYYNQDFKTIEFWDGYNWRQVDYTTQRGRVVFGGGLVAPIAPTLVKRMDYVNIMTLGNSITFGELSVTNGARRQSGGLANSIRGLNAGGQGSPANITDIDYFTMASGGTAADFGNLVGSGKQHPAGASSSTRGLFMGGGEGADVPQTDIDYVEIMTTGNAIDFGDLSLATRDNNALSSPTRAVRVGGQAPSDQTTELDAVTISSLGGGVHFGDLTEKRRGCGCVASSTRGIAAAGSKTGKFMRSCDYFTIATGGNSTDFGNLSEDKNGIPIGSSGNQTRGLFIGGAGPSTHTNRIEYVTISSLGDAQDFGDCSAPTWAQAASCSDSHGGLGGF